MRAKLLFLFAMLFSMNSFAAYTYSSDGGNTHYSSPEAICTALLPKYQAGAIGYSDITFSHFAGLYDVEAYSDGTIAYCYYNRTNKSGDVSIGRHSSLIKRYGSPDAVPEPNACSSAPSAIISRGPYGSVVQSDGKNYVVAPSPSSVCSGNCLYEKPESANTKDCFVLSSDAQTGFCNYAFTLVTADSGDGTSCAINTSIPYETGSSLNDSDDGSDGSGGDGSGDGSGGDGDGSDSGGDGSGEGSGSGDGSGFTSPGSPDFDHREEQRKTEIESQYRGFSTTFQESVTYTTIKSSFQNVGDPGASCPVATFDLFGSSIIFDSHCVLFDSVAPVIGFASMAAWALLALLIILSA